MDNKLVSVCINAYNAEKYILKTIDSVINQSYKNLQIIVVDDCSTDSTYDIVKSINDDRIEVYKTQINGHMSFACNEALKYVKGDYVAHLDADDLWTENKIEKQVDFLEKNSKYGACFTHAEVIDEENNLADRSFDPMRKMFAFENRPHAEMYRFLFDNSNKLCHCSALIRTEIIKKIGNYDVSIVFLQDFDYWMRLLTLCPIYIIAEPLTQVRRHSSNNSDMTDEKWIAYNNESIRIIYKSINLCPDELFLNAFADKLRFQGKHSHDETEIEKAFILLEGPFAYKGNPILGILKFEKLFRNEIYVKLAAEKFNFTTRDLYTIQQTRCFIDIGEYNHLVGTINKLKYEINVAENTLSEFKKYNQDLEKYNQDLENNNKNQNSYIKFIEATLDATKQQLSNAQDAYNQIRNNFFIRVILFIKRLFVKKN